MKRNPLSSRGETNKFAESPLKMGEELATKRI
jgi:hypothetical protein